MKQKVMKMIEIENKINEINKLCDEANLSVAQAKNYSAAIRLVHSDQIEVLESRIREIKQQIKTTKKEILNAKHKINETDPKHQSLINEFRQIYAAKADVLCEQVECLEKLKAQLSDTEVSIKSAARLIKETDPSIEFAYINFIALYNAKIAELNKIANTQFHTIPLDGSKKARQISMAEVESEMIEREFNL